MTLDKSKIPQTPRSHSHGPIVPAMATYLLIKVVHIAGIFTIDVEQTGTVLQTESNVEECKLRKTDKRKGRTVSDNWEY